MSTQLQRRRGTTANHSAFTGATGELTVDTTKNTVVVHDGVTAGGHPLARASDLSGLISAAGIHAATSKGAPVDGDELPLIDSEASNVLKKLTLVNLKAALKTYFDSLTQTLTNKRITPRHGSTTSSATPTINTDNYDIYSLTAQDTDITSFTTNLSGTPSHGDVLLIEIQGTAARAIAWGTGFEASTVALPTTTVTTAMLSVSFIYNSTTAKWRCVGAV